MGEGKSSKLTVNEHRLNSGGRANKEPDFVSCRQVAEDTCSQHQPRPMAVNSDIVKLQLDVLL